MVFLVAIVALLLIQIVWSLVSIWEKVSKVEVLLRRWHAEWERGSDGAD